MDLRTDKERKAREKKELEKMRYCEEGARLGVEAGQRSKQGGGELEKEWMGRERERQRG